MSSGLSIDVHVLNRSEAIVLANLKLLVLDFGRRLKRRNSLILILK